MRLPLCELHGIACSCCSQCLRRKNGSDKNASLGFATEFVPNLGGRSLLGAPGLTARIATRSTDATNGEVPRVRLDEPGSVLNESSSSQSLGDFAWPETTHLQP